MAVTLDYTALVTENEVLQDAIDSTKLTKSGDGDAIRQAILDLTGVVEEHLDRELMVRAQTLRFRQNHWKNRPGFTPGGASGITYTAYAPQWPVVEIVDVDGDSDLAGEITIYNDGRLIGFQSDGDLTYWPTYVNVFAGYRRADHTTLAILRDDNGAELADLGTLPPLLHHEIRGVCVELVLHRLFQAENKQFGTGQKMQNVGGVQATVQATDRAFMQRTLSRLNAKHQRIR